MFNIRLGKRNFLKLAPEVESRGNVFQITLKYQLSGPRGIPTLSMRPVSLTQIVIVTPAVMKGGNLIQIAR